MIRTLILQSNQQFDFSPVEFGQQDCKPCHSYGPHIRNHYLIHYVCSGMGTFESPRGKYTVTQGKAFLIRPGEVCKYTADEKQPWQYIWIGFVGNMASSFDHISDVFEADGLIFEEMEGVFRYSSCQSAYLSACLLKLYCSLFDQKERPDYINQVIGYLNIHYSENVKIGKIANQLGIDRKYLSRIFKQKTGNTMQQFLIQKRVSEGKKLLASGFHVEETALMVGYGDSFSFSKAFKKICGMSPKVYQSKMGRRIGS
ncbi:MAG: AraC family transcriptional regulator [Ruminococcaceae bacterium]|nr:AraC family transcriptional regulator [Oscillospiraceae bacterium]